MGRLMAECSASIWSQTLVAQTNKLLRKVLCHNICSVIQRMYELGIETTFAPDEPHR